MVSFFPFPDSSLIPHVGARGTDRGPARRSDRHAEARSAPEGRRTAAISAPAPGVPRLRPQFPRLRRRGTRGIPGPRRVGGCRNSGPPAGGKMPGRRGMPELPGPSRGAPAQSFFPPTPRIFPPPPRSRTAKRPPAIRTAMTTEPDFSPDAPRPSAEASPAES